MPRVEALEEKSGDRIKITKVEAPKQWRLCLELKVMSLPPFLFFKDGREVDRFTDDVTIKAIEDSIQKLL